MLVTQIKKFEIPITLVYVCIVLILMEYFFIPPRFEFFISGYGVGGWKTPSLNSGIIWSLSCLIGFLVIPSIFVRFVLKQSVFDLGISTKNFSQHLKVYLGFYILMLPLIFFASTQQDFKNLYPFIPEVKTSVEKYFIWELFYVLQFFSLEFFFRGYLLYTLEKHMEKWTAIAIMVVPYTMIHFHKPVLETFGAIVAGFVLGHLALKYRSWLGGALLHSLVALTIDFIATQKAGLFSGLN